MSRYIFYTLIISIAYCVNTVAQQLTIVAETDTYTEYLMENPFGIVIPSYEILIPYNNSQPGYSIIEESVSRKNGSIPEGQIIGYNLSEVTAPLLEISNPGLFRGESKATLKIHVARYAREHTLITEKVRFQVYKSTVSNNTTETVSSKRFAEDHPLASGSWYKIAIPERGIYQLNASYLQSLGIDISGIDPRNIQIWGTDGLVLEETNTAPRPEFSQLPIIVEGETDGSFDTNDRIIFYGNSPHQVFRTASGFYHEIHPYSDSTYVFLTIGNSVGDRFSIGNASMSGSRTINTFQDFIWKEEELTKTEDRQKTGRYWLGQTIPATAQNQFIPIFRDTIPGIIEAEPILLSGRIYARAVNSTSYEMRFNETSVRSFSINRISTSYTSYEGSSANSYTFNNLGVTSPNIENDIVEITLEMRNGDSGANSFIDYIRFQATRNLQAENNRLFFFPPEGGTSDEIVTYSLTGFSAEPYALDVTDPMNPLLLDVEQSGNSYMLDYYAYDQLRILAQAALNIPPLGKLVPNQNLHGISTYPDYIIITTNTFIEYAQELAGYRAQNDGLMPLVVTQDQILNEFSGGSTDPSAIRDFMKYLWDLAVTNGQQLPKHLLLFGDTTYDTKNVIGNAFTNYVLTFQSENSISRIGSYGSDDYFGFLDDGEGAFGINDRIDIGIGRIPSQTRQEAAIALDKIYRYENAASNGDWQNLLTFAGDDDFPNEERNRDLHVWNADGTASVLNIEDPGLRLKKIYLFDYQEEITGAGRLVPGATEDFINTINSGTLIMNYSGHGNAQALSDEGLFLSEYVPQLTNRDKLTIFVTATCQFGRYDDTGAQSGAEKLFFADNGGAIAAFTTTRVVYTSANPNQDYNFGLNIALSQRMLERDEGQRPSTLGDIYLETKNTSAGSSSNSRRFILLGDPALRIALPDLSTSISSINEFDVTSGDTTLTIQALDRVTLSGTIENYEGTTTHNFNGEITVTVLDAKRDVSIPQDVPWIDSGCYLYQGSDRECLYEIENDILFKGVGAVENGQFSIEFVLPKDISFSPENGRILMYAKSENETAGGSFTDVIFNGINENAEDDGTGPSLQLFLNDENFFNGDLTNSSPTLIVELTDSSGINTTGTGVGHEIIATIDTQPNQTFVLNDFYEGTLNDFSSGRIEYPMENIPEGSYTLKVRAWDVHNNSAEEEILFNVANEGVLVVDNVYNYPNPMNNLTSFTFEHNQQGNPLDVDIRIYTLSGRPVQRITQNITNTFSSYASIPWNGRDRDNDRLGNGTYIYVLRVTADTSEGRKSTEKIEKLVIIR